MNQNLKNISAGFTLIELMIVVIVIGILSAIAIPSYQNYVTQSRRAEAQSYMMELALREERHRANNSSYIDHTNLAMNVTNTSHYTFTIAADTNTFTISAAPQGSQATNDSACGTLTLNESGTKGASATNCWKS